jgi:hypothetical protein
MCLYLGGVSLILIDIHMLTCYTLFLNSACVHFKFCFFVDTFFRIKNPDFVSQIVVKNSVKGNKCLCHTHFVYRFL